MSVDNVLLLRVGLDSGTGKGHGPLFEDNSFEYIPIPESSETTEDRTYEDFLARTGSPLSEYAPHLADNVPHFDPEFETYTYGDPSPNKRRQLGRLTSDDLLIFYSSLSPQDVDVDPRLYGIGYFTVEDVYDLKDMTPKERVKIFNKMGNNAHVKRTNLTSESSHREEHPVIVKGRPKESRLFTKARPLGNSNRNVLPWVADIIGFGGDLTRAGVARVLDESNADCIEEWLEKGSGLLDQDDNVLRSYVMTSDRGFAPNVTGGVCTLATCKPRIRRDAKIGDWVLGTPSRSEGEERLVYLARIAEAMTYNEYYHDDRFQMKKPENDSNGDNIYYRQDGVLTQDEKTDYHSSQSSRKRDLGTDRVLIGDVFWYFGDSGVTIPESLRHDVIHRYKTDSRRLYSKKNREALKELVEWCSLRFDPGVWGEASKGQVYEKADSGC